MRQTLLVLAVAWALVCPAAAQDLLEPEGPQLQTQEDLQALTEQALERLTRGQSGGFDVLRQHSIDNRDDAELDRFFRSQADRVKNYIRRWGQPLEHKLIVRQTVADCFCRYVYISKYERNFLRWSFVYYRPKQRWYFFRLDFDDDTAALFEAAGVDVPATATTRPRIPATP
jgi:hypothetical protein